MWGISIFFFIFHHRNSVESLLEYFIEVELSIAVITESWLKPGTVLNDYIEDVAAFEDIGLVHRTRAKIKHKTNGGGFAILYIKNKMQHLIS